MKIALAQFNPVVGDFEGNAERIRELSCAAKRGGADLAVFSELCLCGYPPQDLIERPAFAERNRAELIAEGKVLFEQRKMLLPTYDVFDETRYFQPAHTQHVFTFGGETLGITICEDTWNDKNFWAQRLYARDPVAEIAAKGSTVLL